MEKTTLGLGDGISVPPERRTEASASAYDDPLWHRIETMRIDPPGARTTFIDRLRQNNRWEADHAIAVEREYRRFLYLAARAGHPVTPSAIIDQAWHLHLIYTEHYWRVLCKEILDMPLHHHPSRGGAEEDTKFDRQYAMTLASYRRLFGEAPPLSVWPQNSPVSGKGGAITAIFAITLLAMFFFSSSWFSLIAIPVAIVAAGWVAVTDWPAPEPAWRRRNAAGSGGGGCGGGCGGCGGGCGGCGGG